MADFIEYFKWIGRTPGSLS